MRSALYPILFPAKSSVVVPPLTSAATWDAAAKNPNVTISGAGLIATDTSGIAQDHAGRGTTATTTIGSGVKRFWKLVVTTLVGNAGFGVCNASQTFGDNAFLGGTANGVGWYSDGSVFLSAAQPATFGTFAQGDTLTLVVDRLVTGKMWGAVNGVFSGDPVAGTGGVDISAMGDVFPAYDLKSTGVVTAIFAASGGPSGFSIFP